jgi:eukaryotic-like serine/threonine-protein kinase
VNRIASWIPRRDGHFGCEAARHWQEARWNGSSLRSGFLPAGAAFTAREQVIDFKRATPEVDVWAMAASLYYMLTGAPPRDFPPGRDPWSVVLESPAVPIRQRQKWLPARWPRHRPGAGGRT